MFILRKSRNKSTIRMRKYGTTFNKNEHGPCPNCGGKDRWRWDDRDGLGSGFCNQCNITGDGFKLAVFKLGLDHKRDFPKVVAGIAKIINLSLEDTKASTTTGTAFAMQKAADLWRPSNNIFSGKDVSTQYLSKRGLKDIEPTEALRFHPILPYYEGKKLIGNFPALLAKITDLNGNITGIHRTYLDSLKSTKSGDDRIIEIPKPLLPVLMDLKIKSLGDDLVLPRLSKWDKGEQARELRFFLKSAGLPEIRFHDLRASWATLLLNKGVPPSKVMSMGGWKDLDTMMIYMRKAGINIKDATSCLDDIQFHGIQTAKVMSFAKM